MSRVSLVWLFALLLVIWGNASPRVLGGSAWLPGGSWQWVLAGFLLLALSGAFARALGLDTAALGLRARALRAALTGAALGGGAALAAVFALSVVAPLIVGRAVDYAPLSRVTEAELILHIGVFLPLGDIVPEELAFRGVLLGALLSRGAGFAVLASSAVFALWHVAVAAATVGDTTLGPPSVWSTAAVAGALAMVFVGGVVFAWLRVRTGSLVTTITAHWAFNSVLLLGLWSTRSPAPSGCC